MRTILDPIPGFRIPRSSLLLVFFQLTLLLGCAEIAIGQTNVLSTEVATATITNIGPRIEFAETTHDFGKLESGKVVHWDFAFTNIGDRTLEIKNVASSCGCTTLGDATRTVEPGKPGIVPIQFDSGGMAGPIMKNLSLACNDPVQSNVVLYFKAIVWKPIDAIPGIAAFYFGPDVQTNQTRSIRLVSNVDEPLTLSEPVCTNRSFRAELKTVKEGKEFELLVTVVPPLGPGSWTAPVTLKSSSTRMPIVAVTAYAMVQPALTVSPGQIALPPPPLTNASSFEIAVRSRTTNTLVLSEPSLDVDGAKVRLREVESGRLFQLTVDFPAGFQLPSGRKVEARVKSNHPQMPLVTIPIFQMLPAEDTEESPISPKASTNSTAHREIPSPAQPSSATSKPLAVQK